MLTTWCNSLETTAIVMQRCVCATLRTAHACAQQSGRVNSMLHLSFCWDQDGARFPSLSAHCPGPPLQPPPDPARPRKSRLQRTLLGSVCSGQMGATGARATEDRRGQGQQKIVVLFAYTTYLEHRLCLIQCDDVLRLSQQRVFACRCPRSPRQKCCRGSGAVVLQQIRPVFGSLRHRRRP